MTFFCISFYFKGQDFLRGCKAAGNTVYLLTHKKLEHEAWPRESVDEFFYMEDESNNPVNFDAIGKGFAWLLRERRIDRIVALDDFDVEKAAYLREEFRIPGMGQTRARLFRDKLAMRIQAADSGIPVPLFSSLFHSEDVNRFAREVSPPWLVKPRAEASATGIRKVHHVEELWEVINGLGDKRHQYLVEQFKPGAVYHADALSFDGDVVFCRVSRYLNPPFEVAHGGGIFRSHTVEFGGYEDMELQELTRRVMQAFGMRHSASHTEFIRSDDGDYYFLETSARVGGAHLAEMVEVSSGINLWSEWARLENAVAHNQPYRAPEPRNDYAGILVSLARYEHPDTGAFNDAEIVWRINKKHHVGFIVKSDRRERILELLDEYAGRVYHEYHASAPAPDKPTH